MDKSERRLVELEESNEIEDAEFDNLSRRARRKMLEERMGKEEVARQIADGMLGLGRKGIEKGIEKVRSTSRSEMTRRAGIGGGSILREYNDPFSPKWRNR
ncbi:hypothetical protein LCGC14_0683570 [marine sediment metagenome]|uniref:Uncharacterized protein n=1 Tax=marine sediment metagenome TaxID=412755 RepID=A0A0F9T8T2_9ZZZZ